MFANLFKFIPKAIEILMIVVQVLLVVVEFAKHVDGSAQHA